jgi:cell division protein FtsW (lipid II flippase)
MLPWLGHEIRGARLWLQIGPMSFQPGEVAKVLLVLFVAAYLAERRELLSMRTRRLGPISVPDPRYLVPLGGMIALAMLIFVRQNDLGQPLLFFMTFLGIIWIATGRPVYPVLGLAAFSGAVWAALQFFPHVRPRFDAWLDPFATPRTSGYQIVQGWFAMAEGAMGGVGLVGEHTQPELIPFAWTDLILASIGHTLGLAGLLAVVACYIILLTRIFYIALRSRSELHALAIAGFGIVTGIQAVVIAGGVTRLLPLTGVTLPFVSYGGSSLLTNFVILGCVLAVSNTELTTTMRADELAEEPEEVTV